MKKINVLFILLMTISCSIHTAHPDMYPSGIVFPLVKTQEVSYKGKVLNPIRRGKDHLYFSTDQGHVYCVGLKQLQIEWTYSVPDGLKSPLFLGEENLYFVGSTDTLFCIDYKGQFVWEKKFGQSLTPYLAVDSRCVYMGTEEGNFFAVGREEGRILWKYQAEGVIQTQPVLTDEGVVFGCDHGGLYILSLQGKFLDKIELEEKTTPTLKREGNFLYFGTEGEHIYSYHIKKRRERWKVELGSPSFTSPVIKGKRIFFLCWNGVLYCLNKNSGSILWWNTVPARSDYQLEVVEEKIVVTSLSPRLQCFDIRTGKNAGHFEFPQIIKSNPLWEKPYLMVNLYDEEEEEGKLWFLEKLVRVSLSASKASPQNIGEPVVFSAETTGFFQPQYRFHLSRFGKIPFGWNHFFLFKDKEKVVVQEWSEEGSWEWIPEKEGYYKIQVEVKDEKEEAEAQVEYVIEKEKPQVSLQTSQESPVGIGEKVLFRAKATGFQSPQYEFYITPLIKIRFGWRGLVFVPQEEISVKERSEANSWEWTTQEEGFYFIRVKVIGEEGKAEDSMGFVVEKIEPKAVVRTSPESPQEVDREITFTVQTTGFQEPLFEFFITPMAPMPFSWERWVLVPYGETKLVEESSEENSWRWIPRKEGFYMIVVRVREKDAQAESGVLFLIKSK